MRPDVLLLDEPTAGVDPVGATRIMGLVKDLNENHGLTVVATTHDVDLAAVFAHRVCLLAAGRIVLSGSAAEVLCNATAMRAAGLRLPRIAHLAEIMLERDGLEADLLPLTIGQARRWLKEEMNKKSGGQYAANI